MIHSTLDLSERSQRLISRYHRARRNREQRALFPVLLVALALAIKLLVHTLGF